MAKGGAKIYVYLLKRNIALLLLIIVIWELKSSSLIKDPGEQTASPVHLLVVSAWGVSGRQRYIPRTLRVISMIYLEINGQIPTLPLSFASAGERAYHAYDAVEGLINNETLAI